jgi:hypothetical protein
VRPCGCPHGRDCVDLLSHTEDVQRLSPRPADSDVLSMLSFVLDPLTAQVTVSADETERSAGRMPQLLQPVARLLGATWLLMGQPHLAENSVRPGPDRRTAQPAAATRPSKAVTVVDLRRQVPPPAVRDADTQPAWRASHRWVVRGHWRQQACGPGRSQRRPVWIEPHVKGPDGAPLLAAEKVMVWRR